MVEYNSDQNNMLLWLCCTSLISLLTMKMKIVFSGCDLGHNCGRFKAFLIVYYVVIFLYRDIYYEISLPRRIAGRVVLSHSQSCRLAVQ